MSENNINTKDFVIGTLVGSIVGASIALIFAPKSGKELRGNINTGASQVKDRASEWKIIAQEKGATWKDKAYTTTAEFKQRAMDTTSQISKKTQDLTKTVADKMKKNNSSDEETEEKVAETVQSE